MNAKEVLAYITIAVVIGAVGVSVHNQNQDKQLNETKNNSTLNNSFNSTFDETKFVKLTDEQYNQILSSIENNSAQVEDLNKSLYNLTHPTKPKNPASAQTGIESVSSSPIIQSQTNSTFTNSSSFENQTFG